MGRYPSGKDKGKNLIDRIQASYRSPVIKVAPITSLMDKLDDPRVYGDGKATKLIGFMPDKQKVGAQDIRERLVEFIG